jgi:hypothetical protein
MSVVVTNRGTRIVLLRPLAALGAVALSLGFALSAAAGNAAAGSPVPYSDSAATGSIGLCNQQGQQITSGSISTAPFAWRAVSTAAATGAYAGASRTAILLAFQPIQGLAASDWSGNELTASSSYTNPANPMAAATGGDASLATFMGEFKPYWNGFLELRMYLGAANEQTYSVHYPTLDIQVTGSTWHAVDGSTVDCSAGTAESLESVVLPASALKPPSSSGPTGTQGSTAPAARGGSGNRAEHAGASSSPEHPTAATAAPATESAGSVQPASSSGGWVIAVVVVVVAALLLAVALPRRRRRRASEVEESPAAGASDSPAESTAAPLVTSTKGIHR